MKNSSFYIIVFTIFLSQSLFAQETEIESLTEWFTGEYTTTEQTAIDSQIIDIHLYVTPFDIKDQKGKWFYLETAYTDDKDSPYRQEFFHIYVARLGFVYVDRYAIENSEPYIGAFTNNDLLKDITMEKLQKNDYCTVYLQKRKDLYTGSSNGNKCQSNIRRAKYATTDIEITEVDFFLWEKGFDAQGKQVWGTTFNGYVFQKLKAKK